MNNWNLPKCSLPVDVDALTKIANTLWYLEVLWSGRGLLRRDSARAEPQEGLLLMLIKGSIPSDQSRVLFSCVSLSHQDGKICKDQVTWSDSLLHNKPWPPRRSIDLGIDWNLKPPSIVNSRLSFALPEKKIVGLGVRCDQRTPYLC